MSTLDDKVAALRSRIVAERSRAFEALGAAENGAVATGLGTDKHAFRTGITNALVLAGVDSEIATFLGAFDPERVITMTTADLSALNTAANTPWSGWVFDNLDARYPSDG